MMSIQQELKTAEALNKSFKKSWGVLAKSSQQDSIPAIPAIFESNKMQLYFVEIFTLLHAKSGGDEAFMAHWFNTLNNAFSDTPALLCETEAGVIAVKKYFESELNH